MSNALAHEQPEKIYLPCTSESESLKKIRHTTSHVMAMAVQKLFPKAQRWKVLLNKGLVIIHHGQSVNTRALVAISQEEAQRSIQEISEPYKLEILEDLEDPITIYYLGADWWDLCAGSHVENIAVARAVKTFLGTAS